MYQLCAMIEKEQDHGKFLRLIQELDEGLLLERKEQRFEDRTRDKKRSLSRHCTAGLLGTFHEIARAFSHLVRHGCYPALNRFYSDALYDWMNGRLELGKD